MSPSGFKVVARLSTGDIVRGYCSDFRPGRAHFAVAPPSGAAVRVLVRELKALFFVKSLVGNRRHVQDNQFREEKSVGRRVFVEFRDGEKLAGRVPAYKPEAGGFFLFPNDRKGNIERAWIVEESTQQILFDEPAEDAAAVHVPDTAPPSVSRISPDEWDEMLGITEDDLMGPERADPRAPEPRGNSGVDFLGDW